MKKTSSLFLSLVALAMMTSCSCNRDKGYPASPKNGQRYTDGNGNVSIWNAAMGYWMISSLSNGRYVNHYYYPSTGTYRDENRREIARPAHVPVYRTANSSRSFFSRGSSSSSSSSSKSGFGSSGRSSSAS